MVLAVPAKHPWARRGTVEPEDLRTANLILRRDGSGVHRAAEEVLEKRGVLWEELRVLMEVEGIGLVEGAVGAGLGVALVSRLAVLRFGTSIKMVDINGLSLTYEVYLARNLYRAAGHLSLKFWDFMQTPQVQAMISEIVS